MDVNQVLKGTLSPDGATRTSAEQQLNQAAEQDFSQYLRILAQELANEHAEQDVRMAAGLALKNSFSARDAARLREVQTRWLQQLDPEVKNTVKGQALTALGSADVRAGLQAAQFIASIAAIEIPQNQWPELMPTLVKNVGEGKDQQKQASLATIGYICEMPDPHLQRSLSAHSNSILTAVVQGARKEEPNSDVRNAAITALGDSLEFVRANFENEGERNYIMQVVCEATQASDPRIQQGAYGCLNRIMALYYETMGFYMEQALFGLTIQGMKSGDEDVAKLAIEFWCTVCEEEISIEDDNIQAASEGGPERTYLNFAKIAAQEVTPVLLDLLATQDEDAADEEYNVQRAAYQCLQLYAQAVRNNIVAPVLPYVEGNIGNADWRKRDAAVSAFGAIVEGPDEHVLDGIVKQALPHLINVMADPVVQVKDSTAFTLGRISEHVPSAIDPAEHLKPLIAALFTGLSSNPKMAASCCWALMNLASAFAGDFGCHENPLTAYFQESVRHLLETTARNDADPVVRTAAYEVLNTFVTNAAVSSLTSVAELLDVILQRLEGTIPMRQQVVSVEDKMTLDDMQTSLCAVVMAIVQRLETDIKPQADRIMHILLQLLSTLGAKSTVSESVFAAVGALASSVEEGFQKYMESFNPFLFKALGNKDDPQLLSMAIGLVSDISRSLNERVLPYCNEFMNHLLENLRSPTLQQVKPAILQCFGDVAQAIGGAFDTYLDVVAQVLEQAAAVVVDSAITIEQLDYVVSLREGVMDAWAGAVMAMKVGNKTDKLQKHIEKIFSVLQLVFQDQNRSEALLRSSMGVLGDLADAFPNGEYAHFLHQDWVTAMVKETRTNREFSSRTIETARWAREQIKRQTGGVAQAAPASSMPTLA